MAALPAGAAMTAAAGVMARAAVRAAAAAPAAVTGMRLADSVPREIVDDIFAHALKKQTGVSLKYMVSLSGRCRSAEDQAPAKQLPNSFPVPV